MAVLTALAMLPAPRREASLTVPSLNRAMYAVRLARELAISGRSGFHILAAITVARASLDIAAGAAEAAGAAQPDAPAVYSRQPNPGTRQVKGARRRWRRRL